MLLLLLLLLLLCKVGDTPYVVRKKNESWERKQSRDQFVKASFSHNLAFPNSKERILTANKCES